MKIEKITFSLLFIFLFPAIALAIPRIHAEWQCQPNENIAGFKLYHENTLACEINDPSATSLDCDVDAPDGKTWFTLTSFFNDGSESAHSPPYTYTISRNLKAVISTTKKKINNQLQIEFKGTSSTGNINSYEWAFGDGSTASGSIVTHTYASPGSYVVTLRVTDNVGAIDRETTTVVVSHPSGTVTNTPPIAVISVGSVKGDAPFTVSFNANKSRDPDGAISFCSWHFGDGSSGTGLSTSHTFTKPGKYVVSLCVTDNLGADSQLSKIIIEVEKPGDNEEGKKHINILPIIDLLLNGSRSKN